MEKIKLPVISYKNYKIIEGESEFIELYDDHLVCYGTHIAEIVNDDWEGEEDELMPKKPIIQKQDYSYWFFKSDVTEIERFYCHEDECWKVTITSRSSKALQLNMKSKTASVALCDKLLEWKLLK